MSDVNQPTESESTRSSRGQSGSLVSGRPVSPSLLRRLAEAADGESGSVWFVASYLMLQGKHQVTGPYSSEAEAQANLPAGTEYGVFGPFEAPPTITHMPILQWDVTLGDNTTRSFKKHYDAFFWSESALRKFVLPYYSNLVSPEYATQIRDAFRQPDIIVMAHDPLTEYRMVSVSDTGGFRVI